MLRKRTIIALLVAMTAAAQEPDRTTAAIRSVISELNQARKDSDAKAVSELFTRDGSLAVGNQILASGQTESRICCRTRSFGAK
jgi:hypothetical protein